MRGVPVEDALLERNSLEEEYEVLVAGHHGSRHTAGPAFLAQVRPAFSIVSTNADNIRGYPAPETVDRIRAHTRERVYFTFRDGSVCMEWRAHTRVSPCPRHESGAGR